MRALGYIACINVDLLQNAALFDHALVDNTASWGTILLVGAKPLDLTALLNVALAVSASLVVGCLIRHNEFVL